MGVSYIAFHKVGDRRRMTALPIVVVVAKSESHTAYGHAIDAALGILESECGIIDPSSLVTNAFSDRAPGAKMAIATKLPHATHRLRLQHIKSKFSSPRIASLVSRWIEDCRVVGIRCASL